MTLNLDTNTNNTTKSIDEIDSFMLKVYEQNINKIILLSNRINTSYITTLLSSLILLIMLLAKLASIAGIYYIYLFIPAAISIIAVYVLLNTYLNMKDIFDEAQGTDIERKQGSIDEDNIGTQITYVCLNVSSLMLVVYVLLLTLRLDNMIDYNFNSVSIPVYIIMLIGGFYAVFILPALIQNRIYADIILIFSNLCGIMIFVILINSKLDYNYDISYMNIFKSLFFSFGIDLIYLVTCFFKEFKSNLSDCLCSICFVLSLIISNILIALRLDGVIFFDVYIPPLIILIAYTAYVSQKILKIIYVKEE